MNGSLTPCLTIITIKSCRSCLLTIETVLQGENYKTVNKSLTYYILYHIIREHYSMVVDMDCMFVPIYPAVTIVMEMSVHQLIYTDLTIQNRISILHNPLNIIPLSFFLQCAHVLFMLFVFVCV